MIHMNMKAALAAALLGASAVSATGIPLTPPTCVPKLVLRLSALASEQIA